MKIKKNKDNLEITINVPLHISGEYTYGEGEWKKQAVIVVINEELDEYALYYTQYLEYKDSLQPTMPIVYFDSREEAEKIADEFELSIEYHGDKDPLK